MARGRYELNTSSPGLDKFTDSGTALAQILQKSVLANADREAAMQRQQSEAQAKQAAIEANQQRAQAEAERMGLKPGKYSSSVSEGGFGINPEAEQILNPYQAWQLQNQTTDDQRLETKAIVDDYNKIIPDIRKKANAVTEISKQLEKPSQMTRGQVGAALAKASSSGSISDYEQKQMQPNTLKSWLAGAVNFVRPDTINPYTQGELKNIKDIMYAKKQAYEQELEKANQEVSARASTLAPTLNRTGKLKETLGSLGIGAKSGIQNSSDEDLLLKRKAELEAKARGGE